MLCIISLFRSFAQQIESPNFALPKTVITESESLVNKAEKDGNAHGALNALIRLYVAERLNDPNDLQKVIRKTEKVSAKFSKDKLHGLFQAWLAYLYYSFLHMDYWKYEERQVSPNPLPVNLTEWSGKQLHTRIKELCIASINSPGLKDCPLNEYTDLISCNKLSSIYYTTLQDFVYSNAIELMSDQQDDSDRMDLIEQALSKTVPGSASNILWIWRSNKLYHNYDELVNEISSFIDNQYAGLLVSDAAREIAYFSDAIKYVDMAERYMNNFPDTPFKNNILNGINSCKSEKVEVLYPLYCAPGNEVEVKIENTNATNYYVDIYYTGEKDFTVNGRNANLSIKALRPWKTSEIKNQKVAPFQEDTVIKVKIDRPGYYYIYPRLNSEKTKESDYLTPMRCLGVYPILITNPDKAFMITLDPYTGAPIKNAMIWFSEGGPGEYVKAGESNAMGITDVNHVYSAQDLDNLRIDINDKQYLFPDIYAYRPYIPFEKEQFTVNTLFSRPIYNPGDTVDALVILSSAFLLPNSTVVTGVCTDKKLKISLRNKENILVADTVVDTDSYGRAVLRFLLPIEATEGEYSINIADEDGGKSLGTSKFMVCHYRIDDLEVKINEIACDMPSTGCVTIRGRVATYSGMPVTETKVSLNLKKAEWIWEEWYDNKKSIYTADINTDRNGEFTFVIPNGTLTDKLTMYKANIDVISNSGYKISTFGLFAIKAKYHIELSCDNNINGENLLRPDVKVFTPDGSQVILPLLWRLKTDKETIATGVFDGSIDLHSIPPATYTLTIVASDTTLSNSASKEITIYNRKSGIVPDNAILYLPSQNYTIDFKDKAVIDYANSKDNTYIYYCVNGNNSASPVKMIKADAGYHTLEVDIPDGNTQATIYFYTLMDCKMTALTVNVNIKEKSDLRIVCDSFRDYLTQGVDETWKICIEDSDGKPIEAALALEMYNKALESIIPYNLNINHSSINHTLISKNRYFDTRYLSFGNTSTDINQEITKLDNVWINNPSFYLYGYFNKEIFYNLSYIGNRKSRAYAKDSIQDDDIDETLNAEENIEVLNLGNLNYRNSDLSTAIWAPILNTDVHGHVVYSFRVPDTNTTWRLRAIAWNKKMETGSTVHDFVASKPVMVHPNLPPFLRRGDSAKILALVMNNTDTTQIITTTVEIFDPLSQVSRSIKTFTNTIKPMQTDTVVVDMKVDDEHAVGYRVKSSNGTSSDGEQQIIKVLGNNIPLNVSDNHSNQNSVSDFYIEKQLLVQRASEWVLADSLHVGDRVKIVLTINCNRNIKDLKIIDEHPAAFLSVDKLPKLIWAGTVENYMENREGQTIFNLKNVYPRTYIMSYEMYVTLAGNFFSGETTIKSQSDPELSANSSSWKIKIN